MSAGQIELSSSRLRAPWVAAMVVAAFAGGTLTGINLPSAVGGRSDPISSASLDAAAAHDMSAAAYAALHPATIAGASLDAAAAHDMSAAAYAALHPAMIAGASLDAAAAHDMSAAAYAALHPSR